MRNRLTFVTIEIFAYVLLVTLLGCTRNDPPSLILANESLPPCWFGICPGMTGKSEALVQLQSMPFVESNSVIDMAFNDGSRGSYISWQFAPEVKDFGRLYYEGTQVTWIEITPQPKASLSLGDLVTTFGEPEQIWAFSDCAESRWLYLAFIYREQGMYAVSFDDDWEKDESAMLTPDHPITNVIFYAPSEFRKLMMDSHDAIWPAYGYDYEDILKGVQPWQGYEEIDILRQCF